MIHVCTTLAALQVCTLVASSVSESSLGMLILHPEKTLLWSTCTNDAVSVAVPFPPGATSASLTVDGYRYHTVTNGIVTDTCRVTLPVVRSFDDENVYDLTLTFDNGASLHARVGDIHRYSASNEGVTRVLGGIELVQWSRVNRKAAIPFCYGDASPTVDGLAVDTGLDGAAGWWLYVPGDSGVLHTLVFDDASAVLRGRPTGFFMAFQ